MDHPDRSPPAVPYFQITDIGLRRLNNQDACACVPARENEVWEHRGHLFLVADGMGAHAAGELASKIAAEDVPLAYQKVQRDIPAPVALKQAIEDANETIHRKGSRNFDFQGMGTTCTALVLFPQGALVGHVGDSRAYRLRGTKLEQLTRDHSLVWELKEHTHGELGPGIPRNIITRSLGPNPDVEVDIEGPFEVLPGDRFLLCSDGLCGQLDDRWIGVVLRLFPLQEAAQLLVHLANLRGGPDNITVVVLESPVALAAPHTSAAIQQQPDTETAGWWIPATGLFLGALLGALVSLGKQLPLLEGAIGTLGGACAGLALGLAARSWSKTSPRRFGRKRRRPLLHGSGPYTETPVVADEKLVEELGAILDQLCRAASDEEWNVCWQEIDQLKEQAHQAIAQKNWDEAVQMLGQAVLQIMSHAKHSQAETE